MNKEKFEKKINKKYGTNSLELKDLSVSKIKNLKNINHTVLKENDKFKVVKKPIKGIIKGATLGMGVAGSINTIFPNIVPVVGTYITTSSNISDALKITLLTTLASLPVDLASGYVILGIGAGIGSILYSGYSLVKITVNNLRIVRDRSLCKKLNTK